MFLKYIQIINYKNSKASRFEFSKGANTIIGENDTGKTNALTAMRILLDDTYYYSLKRLKESDFSYALGEWRGHWIIISAFFDEISEEDKTNELCAELIPDKDSENKEFLKSYIRCAENNYGTVTLFIRPNKAKRKALFDASSTDQFDLVRSQIKLSDYEFYYASRTQADFTDEETYKTIVGDLEQKKYANPDADDSSILGTKIEIMNVWQHISMVYIDALRDVEGELRKPKNPIRQVISSIEGEIASTDIEDIKIKVHQLNDKISSIPQIHDVGERINRKLLEMIGTVYSPDIKLESRFTEDFSILAKYLTMIPANQTEIEQLGLGHLNILYMAMKLVEFEANRTREILNIMIIEEPEAHIHTHIQKTLFDNLQIVASYTQVIMSTHSTHLSEVSDINKVNIMKKESENVSCVMRPTNNLDSFGINVLDHKGLPFSQILARYLDAKRSVLLFSKGIVLVEGDGEEILIPNLIKKVLGISLDEIGIGLINVGSVAFENIACIFHKDRLKRKCAIITDLDTKLNGAEKSSEKASLIGKSRKEKLTALFASNQYVKSFYADYTLEVDFANIVENRDAIYEIIDETYTQQAAINRHKTIIKSGSDAKRYDSILSVVNHIKKGWYATILSSKITFNTIIPQYILDAVAFASSDIISINILWKMVGYSLTKHQADQDYSTVKEKYDSILSAEERDDFIKKYVNEHPEEMISVFINKVVK